MTGGAESAFTFLFALAVIAAGMVLSTRGALWTTGAAAAVFVILEHVERGAARREHHRHSAELPRGGVGPEHGVVEIAGPDRGHVREGPADRLRRLTDQDQPADALAGQRRQGGPIPGLVAAAGDDHDLVAQRRDFLHHVAREEHAEPRLAQPAQDPAQRVEVGPFPQCLGIDAREAIDGIVATLQDGERVVVAGHQPHREPGTPADRLLLAHPVKQQAAVSALDQFKDDDDVGLARALAELLDHLTHAAGEERGVADPVQLGVLEGDGDHDGEHLQQLDVCRVERPAGVV